MKKIILTLLLSILFISSYSQNDWTLIHPTPTLSNLNDVQFISEQEGWAVGTDGTIIYTNNKGESWVTQHYDDDESFRSVFFINENEGWVVGWSKIYHTTNNGDTWEQQERPLVYGDLADVFFANPDTGWIVGSNKIILRTTDGGENWNIISNLMLGPRSLRSVCFKDELNGCAVGGRYSSDDGYTIATVDGGLTWTETTPEGDNEFSDITFLDNGIGWICGMHGELFKTYDGGFTWEDSRFSYNYFKDIHFFDSVNGMLLDPGNAYLTFNGGETWDSVVSMWPHTSLTSFSNSGSDNGFAVGYGGTLSTTADGGSTWQAIGGNDIGKVRQIGFLNTLDGYAITRFYLDNLLFKTEDGGYNWIEDTIIDNGPFYLMKINGQSFYLLNDSSQLMKSLVGGNDWELLAIPDTTAEYNDIQFVNDYTAYLCSSDGILFKTTDGGITWTDKSLSGDFTLTDLLFVNQNLGWMIDPVARLVLRTTDGGDNWTFYELGDFENYQPSSIFFLNETLGFITTEEGIVFRTSNSGDTWEEYYVFSSGFNSEIHFVNELEGWYHASYMVYHTYDGGDTWTGPQSFYDAQIQDMFFLDNQGWLGGWSGLIATSSFFVDIENKHNNNSEINIFPNPASSLLEVNMNDHSDKILVVEVLNVQGQKVLSVTELSNNNYLNIDISSLVSGTYFVHIITSKNEAFNKIIVR